MKAKTLGNVKKAIKGSAAIAAAKAVKKAKGSVLFGVKAKPVSHALIAALEANGCWCDDWSRVKAAPGFDPFRVWRTGFIGDVVLAKFEGKNQVDKGVEFANGVYDSTVANCEIGDALVYKVSLLSDYIVKCCAVVANCGTVAVTGETAFGNGAGLTMAIETGGRETRIFGEMSCLDAECVDKSRDDKKFVDAFNRLVDQYVAEVTCAKGTIESKAVVRNTPRVENVYVGEAARIDGAALVRNATLLSSAGAMTEIADGAWVADSLVQRGVRVVSPTVVDAALLFEGTRVARVDAKRR